MFIQVKKERDLYFDFLKGMLILLVLLGHAIQYGNGNEYLCREIYWNNNIMKVIYSFHMPLFSAVSGYFHFISTRRRTSLAVCIKRWQKLTIPIIAWAPIIFVCKTLTNGYYPSFKSVLYALVTDYWFIWAIMIGAGLVCIITKLKNRMFRLCVYLIVFLAFLFSPDLLWVGAAFKYVILFYFLGYELANTDWRSTIITKCGTIVGLGIWSILLCFYNKDCYVYTSLYSISDAANPLNQFAIDIFRYVIGLVGSFTFCSLIHWVWMWIKDTDGLIKEFLLGMGQHSLAIYILSTPLYLYVIPVITYAFTPSIIATVAVTLSMAFCCMLITALLGKNKFISHLLLGE